jgi:N-acetylglucosaminyldiphosphoundecaprenol N-acetyl-beta-D-mannosaminyltransferase
MQQDVVVEKERDAGRRWVVAMPVDETSYASATDTIVSWARAGEARRVCIGNVHMAMEAFDDPDFSRIVATSDMVTPDGVPLVWALRMLGGLNPSRVYGPELTLHICRAAAATGIPVGFYGGTEDSLRSMMEILAARFPGLEVAAAISPPFRPLTEEEDADFTKQLAESGARIVFVGIGCPRQERWMSEHIDRIPAVMIGVGAAFDFISGRVRQAPSWIQVLGMEWCFRLAMEPRRLWKRYARHNPRFAALMIAQLLRIHRPSIDSRTARAASGVRS